MNKITRALFLWWLRCRLRGRFLLVTDALRRSMYPLSYEDL